MHAMLASEGIVSAPAPILTDPSHTSTKKDALSRSALTAVGFARHALNTLNAIAVRNLTQRKTVRMIKTM